MDSSSRNLQAGMHGQHWPSKRSELCLLRDGACQFWQLRDPVRSLACPALRNMIHVFATEESDVCVKAKGD